MISFIAITLALALGLVIGGVGFSIAYFSKLSTCSDFHSDQTALIGIIGAHHPQENN